MENMPIMQETQVQSLGWKDPLEKRMAIHSSYSCLENSTDRNLADYIPWRCKESVMTEPLSHVCLFH